MVNSVCQLTAARLRELLHYDPDTGVFTWLVKRTNNVKPGDRAGSLNSKGYIGMSVDWRPYTAHRLAWLYMTGEWPAEDVDHVDRDRSNNVWSNLRAASRSMNCGNKTRQCTNSTGFKGVEKCGRRYSARIGDPAKRIGMFDTPEEAHAAYLAKARELFGDFACAG